MFLKKLCVFRKKSVMLITAGISLGILLILFSDSSLFLKTDTGGSSDQFDEAEYTDKLEAKAILLISQVKGVISADVKISLECTYETIYAKDTNSGADGYFTVREESGKESGLELKTNMPKVRGVAVVYKGEDSAGIKSEIISLVTALYNITSTQVYVGTGI